MKINNERLYVVDIYRADKVGNYIVGKGGDALGCMAYEEKLYKKDIVCVKIGCDYVAVENVDGWLSYMGLRTHEKDKHTTVRLDDRFVGFLPNAQGFYVKNVRPLYKENGKTDLNTLKEAASLWQTKSPITMREETEPEVERE